METFTLTARDGSTLFCRKWQPEDPENIRAVVQIAHGMAEHSGRYDAFARALAEKGMAVYANDHRGHGHTAGHEEKLGYFAE